MSKFQCEILSTTGSAKLVYWLRRYCTQLPGHQLERFSIESRKTKTKVITMSNQKEAKQEKLPKARENAGDQVVIGFSFASDWLGEWREFSEPITERNTEKFI